VVITARGCPYSCTYCYNYKVKELYKGCSTKHLRFRPVDDVIDEIQAIKDNYPIDFIYFGTDCFTASKKWSLEFAEKYKKLSIPFWCMTRPETTSLEVCQALKSCGCQTMSLGIESGSEELRRALLNRTMTNDDIIKAAAAIRQAGLKLYTFNMMALPEETLEQAYSTMEINQKCKTDYPAVTLFQPYPRTSLTEDAIKKGLFDGDYDKLSKSYYRYSALKNPQRKELENLQKLLSIAVEFPALTSLVKFLIRLPLGSLYLQLNKVHKAYCFFFRITPIKVTFKEFMGLVWQLIKDPS